MIWKTQAGVSYHTTSTAPCQMNLVTQKVIDYLAPRYQGKYEFVDLTWFNQFDTSIFLLECDYIIAVDVADPPYFLQDKLDWINSVNKPVIFVGPPNNFYKYSLPFLAWLRFRPQSYTDKISYDNFFVSFNRKPHQHRQEYINYLTKFNMFDKGVISYHDEKPLHEIHSLSLDKNIVRLQNLAQVIDDKQLNSSFEIICETSAENDHVFLTEKFNKCVASQTPLFLAGNYGCLTMLKHHYGFTDFGPDDSYDTLPTYKRRVIKMLSVADLFFHHPLNSVFDNAKKNAYHLFNDFDSIHDKILDRFIEKSKRYVKNSSSYGLAV